MYCCPNNGAHQLAVDTGAGVSVLDDQSRSKPLFQNLTPTHVFKFPNVDSLWMLLQVPSKASPKILEVRAALKTMGLNLSLISRLIIYWRI